MKLRWVNRLEKSKKSWKNLTETNRNPSFFMFTSPATAYFKAQLKLCSMKMIPIPRWDTSTWSPNYPRFRNWITTTSQQCSTAVVKRCPRLPPGALANRTTQAVNLTKTWFYCLAAHLRLAFLLSPQSWKALFSVFNSTLTRLAEFWSCPLLSTWSSKSILKVSPPSGKMSLSSFIMTQRWRMYYQNRSMQFFHIYSGSSRWTNYLMRRWSRLRIVPLVIGQESGSTITSASEIRLTSPPSSTLNTRMAASASVNWTITTSSTAEACKATPAATSSLECSTVAIKEATAPTSNSTRMERSKSGSKTKKERMITALATTPTERVKNSTTDNVVSKWGYYLNL